MEHAPQSGPILDFGPVVLNDFPTVTEDQAWTEDQSPTQDLTPTQEKPTMVKTVLCSVCATQTVVPERPRRGKKPARLLLTE